MTTLNVLLTHLAAPEVDEQLANLRSLAPSSRFVACHGGRREDFEAIHDQDKAFVADPTLRAAPRSLQSYTELFSIVHDRWLRADPGLASVYVIEYDHLVLRPDFETALHDLAVRVGASLLGKTCIERTATNWEHYVRFRRDEALLAHLRRVSVRDDPTRLFGALADGLWLTREAVTSYLEVGEHPPCYCELYVPTLLHHLGHDVVDVDAVSDLYTHVRWEPAYGAQDVRRIRAAGATFAHPVKDPAIWREVAAGSS